MGNTQPQLSTIAVHDFTPSPIHLKVSSHQILISSDMNTISGMRRLADTKGIHRIIHFSDDSTQLDIRSTETFDSLKMIGLSCTREGFERPFQVWLTPPNNGYTGVISVWMCDDYSPLDGRF